MLVVLESYKSQRPHKVTWKEFDEGYMLSSIYRESDYTISIKLLRRCLVVKVNNEQGGLKACASCKCRARGYSMGLEERCMMASLRWEGGMGWVAKHTGTGRQRKRSIMCIKGNG